MNVSQSHNRIWNEAFWSGVVFFAGVVVAFAGPRAPIDWDAARGLSFSVFSGAAVGPLRTFAYRRIDRHFKPQESEWYSGPDGGWVSYVFLAAERALFTAILALEVNGAGAFILGVIALKMASGWNLERAKPDPRTWQERKAYGVTAVNLNLLSLIFVVVGAGIWNPQLFTVR